MSGPAQIIKAAQARQVTAECWLLDRRVSEYVVRDGEVERLGQVAAQRATVSARTGQQEGYLSCPVDADPEQVVDAALATAAALPPSGPALARAPRVADVPGADGATELPAGHRQRLAAATRPDAHTSVELRLHGEDRTVVLADTDGLDLRYRTGLAMATVRVTVRQATVAQLTHDYFAPTLAALAQRLCDRDIAAQAEHAALLSRAAQPLAGPVGRVLLHGRVASRILSLLCPAVGVDAVTQGRSLLAAEPGTVVAAAQVSITDDLTDDRCPLRLPWDDEGTAVEPVPLVTGGVLRQFLADRRYAEKTGAARTGSGWRGQGGEMPTIRPGCLLFDIDTEPVSPMQMLRRHGEPVLHVVQANGMNMANDVTGEFSFAASGLLYTVDEPVATVTGLTVAGNVYDLLRTVREHDGDEVLWRHEMSFVSSPGIWTSALTVGQ